MKMTDAICQPLTIAGRKVSSAEVASVIDEMAMLPARMVAMDMISARLMPGDSFRNKQEVMNRLCQRWRKLGLMSFKQGRWELSRGAWNTMQAAVRRVRDGSGEAGETQRGSTEGDSPAPQGDAQPSGGNSQ